jgi:hypothetical protein
MGLRFLCLISPAEFFHYIRQARPANGKPAGDEHLPPPLMPSFLREKAIVRLLKKWRKRVVAGAVPGKKGVISTNDQKKV